MNDPRPAHGPPGSPPTPLTALEVVVTFIAIAVFAGAIFLTSPPPDRVPDGAIPWAQDSVLQAVTNVLAFEFKIPTPFGAAIKGLVGGLGAAALTIAVCLGLLLMKRDQVHTTVWADDAGPAAPGAKRHIDPQRAAELLAIAVVLVSVGTCAVAVDRHAALGGTLLLVSHLAWTMSLRCGLGRRSAAACSVGLGVVLLVCAVLGIWYFYGRNPNMRLGYPVGNPLFLSACLIPGVMLAGAWCVRCVIDVPRRPGRAVAGLLGGGLAVAAIGMAMWLTQSRGTGLGLAAGLAALVFVAVRARTGRVVVALATVGAIGVGYAAVLHPLIEARGDTVRSRLYAWDYALELTTARPILGHGQGGYAQLADGMATRNVLDDPWALKDRLAHAHNEWLELLTDIGSFGMVAFGGMLCLTFLAGVRAADAATDPSRRWLLIGLLAALVAMIAEECTNVALRIDGFPTIFFGVLGLIWALTAPPRRPARAGSGLALPTVLATMGIGAGLFIGVAHVWDFRAARALHDYTVQLRQRHFDEGLATVDLAARYRLSPQRRLSGALSAAGANLFVAGAHFEDLLRVRHELQQSPAAPAALSEAASAYFEETIAHARAAIDRIEHITARVGPTLGAHSIAGDAHDIISRCVTFIGDTAQAEAERAAALTAYRVELTRQPHDRDLVWRVLELAGTTDPGAVLDLIAPPMRYLDIDDRYLQAVDRLARVPGFDDVLAARVAEAMAHAQGAATRPAFASETLRVAAWVASFRRAYRSAADLCTVAVDLADRQAGIFPTTPSICRRELARYLYLVDPEQPGQALDMATRALQMVPAGFAYEPIRRQIVSRTTTYLLSRGKDGDEDRALAAWYGGLPPAEQRAARLAELYQMVCNEIIQFIEPDRRPAYLAARIDRLAELAPADPAAALMSARLAFDTDRPDDGLAHLRRAREQGADAALILGSRGWLEERYPQHAGLAAFMDALAAEPGPAPDAPADDEQPPDAGQQP